MVFEYNSQGYEFFIIMKGEVEILIPESKKVFLLPEKNNYSLVLKGKLRSGGPVSDHCGDPPTQPEYEAALLAYSIQNYSNIAWMIYKEKDPECKLPKQIQSLIKQQPRYPEMSPNLLIETLMETEGPLCAELYQWGIKMEFLDSRIN
jgi:hypothetical protein